MIARGMCALESAKVFHAKAAICCSAGADTCTMRLTPNLSDSNVCLSGEEGKAETTDPKPHVA